MNSWLTQAWSYAPFIHSLDGPGFLQTPSLRSFFFSYPALKSGSTEIPSVRAQGKRHSSRVYIIPVILVVIEQAFLMKWAQFSDFWIRSLHVRNLRGKLQGSLSQMGDFSFSKKQKYQWQPCFTILWCWNGRTGHSGNSLNVTAHEPAKRVQVSQSPSIDSKKISFISLRPTHLILPPEMSTFHFTLTGNTPANTKWVEVDFRSLDFSMDWKAISMFSTAAFILLIWALSSTIIHIVQCSL